MSIERIDSSVGRLPLHGVASTRRLEAAALSSVPPFTLMARAGDAVARLALALAPHAERIVVYAGPGNNGGDGIEAARRLRAFGKDASVVLVGDASRRPVDAAQALSAATADGVPISAWDGADDGVTPDLVIDALLGFATSRAPEGALAAAITRIDALSKRGARALAVDVPSGLGAERGQPLGDACVTAHDTLSLLTLKPGLFTAEGRDRAGCVWLAALDDEIDASRTDGSPDAWLSGRDDPACDTAPRRHAGHKGSYGDVAVIGGATGMAGAAWLAARAAHAAGSGRVFVNLLDAGGATAIDPTRPELMTRPGWWRGPPAAIAGAVTVCGCGGGDAVRAALPRLLAASQRLVLDADALNAIAADVSLQAQLTGRDARGHATVLTPHPLEAARLLGSITRAVQADRLASATSLASSLRCTVVLKGSGTVIAAPNERPRLCATGNASLATAGSGDVLAGWLGGRWAASGDDAFTVATRAVVEHGAAAEPERCGALRSADLIEELYRRSRA